ncbi:MAG: hypothetical protein Q4G27_08335 [Flavobacteriaceae bacterium]|nr:hypothetical protein [Flavobacteriaceae bacterium]
MKYVLTLVLVSFFVVNVNAQSCCAEKAKTGNSQATCSTEKKSQNVESESVATRKDSNNELETKAKATGLKMAPDAKALKPAGPKSIKKE